MQAPQCCLVITDINDNAPMFDEELVTVEVLENVSIGLPLATISASDVDIGNNVIIQYRLLANEATFAINQLTGIIIVKEPLDYESVNQLY